MAGSAKEAISRAAAVTKSASSSFYWAMRLMPRPKREAMFAIYAFCRVVDDIADEPGMSRKERLAALGQWRQRIARLMDDGLAEEDICRALLPSVRAFGLRKEDFVAVIDGMEMDATGPIVAPDMATLDLYCDRVASAVGRLSVRVFGEPGELGRKIAHHQGRALQLANILRDVQEDAEDGRLYLPRELLDKHGVDISDPAAVTAQPGYAGVWRDLARVTQDHFDATRALFAKSRADLRPAYIMMEVYERNFCRMRTLTDAELADPAVSKRMTSKSEKLFAALKIWLWGRA